MARRDGNDHGVRRDALLELSEALRRNQARARRTWRNYRATDETADPGGVKRAHQAWSDAIDDTLRLVDAISRERPRDLVELLIQFNAIWWWISEDDSVLDSSTRKWLGRFRRSLRRLALGKQ